MLPAFGFVARHGRFVLVAGLVAGLALPGVAAVLRPWLSELVLVLLFLTAFRVGLPKAIEGMSHVRRTALVVLGYQLALPLLCIAVFACFSVAQSPAAIALTLMLSAPSVTGSPNMSVMLGHEPEPAFRLLILGTLVLPVTIVPIFWLSPALGDLGDAVTAAGRLGLTISLVIAAAFMLRARLRPAMQPEETQAVDGITSLALAIIVIGLMSAVAPTLSADPWTLAGWMGLVFGANLGLQALAYVILKKTGEGAAAMTLVAGNRNVALFLLASPAAQTDTFLVFLGCYQFPMYLTPILMRRLYRDRDPST